jgi:HAD superfamily hydrolase (TIGR01509 family)
LFKAALYDLDGLMVDSEPIHEVATEKVLNKYGHTRSDIPEKIRKDFYGKRLKDIAEEVVKALGLEIDPLTWTEERHQFFLELIGGGVPLMDGLLESIAYFRGRGMLLAVVSSGDRRHVKKMLDVNGLESSFDKVINGDDVTVGKPDPQCYLKGAAALGVEPGECIVLEDAAAGISAGVAGGMKVIAVRNVHNANYDGAHAVIENLAKIDDKLLAGLEK